MGRKTLDEWRKEAAALGIKLTGKERIRDLRELIEAKRAEEDPADDFTFQVDEEEVEEIAKEEVEPFLQEEPQEPQEEEPEPEMKECKGLFRLFPNTPEFFPCPGHPYSRAYYEWKGKKPPCEREG